MTLQRDRTNIVKDVKLAGTTYGVFYHPKGSPNFSATRSFRFVATFDTPTLVTGTEVFSWKDLQLFGVFPYGSSIRFYIKEANNIESLENASWKGPYLNGINSEGETDNKLDLSFISGKVVIIRILISSYSLDLVSTADPKLDKLLVKVYSLTDDGKFFTKTFDLGFIPKHIVLTYNGTVLDDSLLQFALTGKDSVSNSDYQTLTPNKLVELNQLSSLSDKMKLMIRASGERSSNPPFEIDGFALIVGGDGKELLNQ